MGYKTASSLHPALCKLTAAAWDARSLGCPQPAEEIQLSWAQCADLKPSLGRGQVDHKFEAGLGYVVSWSPGWDTQLDTVSRRGGSGGGERGKRNIHGSHGAAADTAGRGGLLLALRPPPVPPFSRRDHKCASERGSWVGSRFPPQLWRPSSCSRLQWVPERLS